MLKGGPQPLPLLAPCFVQSDWHMPKMRRLLSDHG